MKILMVSDCRGAILPAEEFPAAFSTAIQACFDVAQTFLSAGSRDILVPWFRRLESRVMASDARNSWRPGSWPETFINPTDDSTMRLVQAGTFTMGSTEKDIETARNMDQDGPSFALHETPQFDLFVPPFYMSVFTVTNEQFARFLFGTAPA